MTARASGLFITFEGIDGCGKTTQAQLLAAHCEANHIPYLRTREPGGEPRAEAVRELLLQAEAGAWEMESELLLFLAARLQHVRRVIQPALQAGRMVICDRFLDSSRIYQCVARGISPAFYDTLHRLVLGNFAADVTFLLDIPAAQGLARANARFTTPSQDYFESQGLDFYDTVRSGFLSLAAHEPQRIHTLDATLPEHTLHHAIITTLKNHH